MSVEERDFLDEGREEETEEVTGEETNASETEETDETETAETPEAKTPKEPEAPAAPEPHEEHSVPYAAMKAEREKRQERERELAELRRQLEERQSPKEPEKPAADIWDDPDAFVSQRVQAVEQKATNRLYAALEAQARETFPDYDEVFAEVEEHAKTNPGVGPQILSSPNPALAAYKLGKQLREMKQMEDPEAYRAKVAAEVRAEIEAETKAKAEAKRKAAEAIPPDLSQSRNVAGNEPPAEDTFDTLFPRN